MPAVKGSEAVRATLGSQKQEQVQARTAELPRFSAKPLHDESVTQVQHALAQVLEEADVAFRERAETLVAIAEHYQVPIVEALLPWIDIRTPEKEWSGVEWRRWCQRFAEARAELLKRHLEEQQLTLKELTDRITPENRHPEVRWEQGE